MTQLKALSTQEEIDAVNQKINLTARDIGITQHNIRKYQEDADTQHLTLKNLIIDLGKLSKKLEKEKAKEVIDPPATDKNGVEYVECTTTECQAAEAQDVVQ